MSSNQTRSNEHASSKGMIQAIRSKLHGNKEKPPRITGLPMPPVTPSISIEGLPRWPQRHGHSTQFDPDRKTLESCSTQKWVHNCRMLDKEDPNSTWYPIKYNTWSASCSVHNMNEPIYYTEYERGPTDSANFVARSLAHRLPSASCLDTCQALSRHRHQGSHPSRSLVGSAFNVFTADGHFSSPAPTFEELEKAGHNPHGRKPQDIKMFWNCDIQRSHRPTCEPGWEPVVIDYDAGQSYCNTHKMAETFYASVYSRAEANSPNIPPLDLNSQCPKAEETNKFDVSEKSTD